MTSDILLIVPRSDGLLVMVEGAIVHKTISAEEMLGLGERCVAAGREILRNERMVSTDGQAGAMGSAAAADVGSGSLAVAVRQ